MAECNIKNTCLFYKKYKNVHAAKKAFIEIACGNDSIPCARRIWMKQLGKQAPEDYAPSGHTLDR
jgi:hypothetical protein